MNQVIAAVEREINSPDIHLLLLDVQEEHDILIVPTLDFVPPQRPGNERQGRRGIPRGIPPFETITEVREFTLNDGQTISLTFHAIIVPVGATVATLQMQLYFISGAMILLSVILAIIMAKRVFTV